MRSLSVKVLVWACSSTPLKSSRPSDVLAEIQLAPSLLLIRTVTLPLGALVVPLSPGLGFGAADDVGGDPDAEAEGVLVPGESFLVVRATAPPTSALITAAATRTMEIMRLSGGLVGTGQAGPSELISFPVSWTK